jgi:hypothetical protein
MRGCGRIERPAFPAPSEFRGREIDGKTSDASRRENAESCFGNWGNVIARSDLSAVAQRAKAEATNQLPSVIPGWCASTRPGISRFRVRCFASPRNDEVWIASLALAMTGPQADPLASNDVEWLFEILNPNCHRPRKRAGPVFRSLRRPPSPPRGRHCGRKTGSRRERCPPANDSHACHRRRNRPPRRRRKAPA